MSYFKPIEKEVEEVKRKLGSKTMYPMEVLTILEDIGKKISNLKHQIRKDALWCFFEAHLDEIQQKTHIPKDELFQPMKQFFETDDLASSEYSSVSACVEKMRPLEGESFPDFFQRKMEVKAELTDFIKDGTEDIFRQVEEESEAIYNSVANTAEDNQTDEDKLAYEAFDNAEEAICSMAEKNKKDSSISWNDAFENASQTYFQKHRITDPQVKEHVLSSLWFSKRIFSLEDKVKSYLLLANLLAQR